MKLSEFKPDPLRLLEAAPSFIFLLFWRTGQDTELSGWIGCGLAAVLLLAFAILKLRHHPIMLGINIHLLLAAPVITLAFEMSGPKAGEFLLDNVETGVLVVVFATGVALTFLSRGGFLGEPEVPWHINWRFSLLMLICLAGMIPFSIQIQDIPFLAVGGPLIVMFFLRNYLARQAPRPDGDEPAS